MGMFGRGIAFGQQFMPRPAIRFRGGPMMPRGGPISFNYHENITVQQGPTGFWGFMSGFMPSFLNTFAHEKKLSKDDIKELETIIEQYREEEC